ncbi:MAG TPA: M23 family metallopeptidase [Bryobacteraceae bacterium]|nr:M23 family metallopeptidase [Bryobacteraceae bacterium]
MFRICNSTQTAALAVLGLSLLTAANAQQLMFFSRSSDIGENVGWVVDSYDEGPNILDLKIQRYTNGGWTWCKEGADCSTNAGQLTFGAPVYAPADGVIRTCWRNFDDNPAPGVKLKRVTGEDGVTPVIFTAGNHVNIETPEGNVILLGHLKKGSVPANLCPFNAEEANVSKNGGDYPVASIIPVGQRPQVRRGQFIGYAGNSGNSGRPHLHIHMAPKEGDNGQGSAVPMSFLQAWAHHFNNNANVTENGWYKLAGTPLTSTSGATLVRPSPFLRRASEADDQITAVDPVYLTPTRAVTVVEDHLHQLKLISWDVTPSGIVRKFDRIEGLATKVKAVAYDASHVVAAVRDSNGNLKLIFYSVGPTGIFTRVDDATADAIDDVDIAVTSANDKKIIVALRRADDKLKIMVWDIDWSVPSGRLEHQASRLEAGTISALALTAAKNFHGAAVAVRTADNNLKVIPYKVAFSGTTIERGQDYEAGAVSTVMDITSIPKGVVVAMKDSAGDLRVIGLETSTGGDIAGNKEVAVVNNTISEVSIDRTSQAAGGNLAVTIRAANGDLYVLGWKMSDRGENIRRTGSSKAGEATRAASVGYHYTQYGQSPRDMILTAVRDNDQNLKLVLWETNLAP